MTIPFYRPSGTSDKPRLALSRTAGVLIHGLQYFAGYDDLRIGDVDLQGPLVGVGWWF